MLLLPNEGSSSQANAKGSAIVEGLELDRFILSQISSLTQLDLVDAVDVFANSTLKEL